MPRQFQRTADAESTTRLGSKWFFRSNRLSSYQLLPISRARRLRFAVVASANRTAPRASSLNPLNKQQGLKIPLIAIVGTHTKAATMSVGREQVLGVSTVLF